MSAVCGGCGRAESSGGICLKVVVLLCALFVLVVFKNVLFAFLFCCCFCVLDP